MIVDDLKNFDLYLDLNKNFKKVSDFLTKNDLSDMPTGSYELDGRNIYVNIDEYETKQSSFPEAHRNYLDIQIILKGHEKIGYADYKTGKTEIAYNPEKDIEFLSADCEFLKAYKGRFFIFYPQDIHQPCITDGEKSNVKKAVFKIKL
ncbi:MAG: YhcH/YjgK/YiaL family protein [Candidatus Gastranaerophilales bacterium]|nr:YhcH/YjgK/YiaL family protein [Candidatus Gastranaerophilales bacterium]